MTDVELAGKRNQVNDCKTVQEALDLAFSHVASLKRHAQDMANDLFWLGASLSKAESLSNWGSGFYEEASKDLGISTPLLRRAICWYDLHAGNAEAMQAFVKGINKKGALTAGKIQVLIKANPKRIKVARSQRHYEDQMRAAGKTPTVTTDLPPIQNSTPKRLVHDAQKLHALAATVRATVDKLEKGPLRQVEVRTFEQNGKTYRLLIEEVQDA